MPNHSIHALLRSPRLLEALASIEHERWSHWQRYLHEQCIPRADGSLMIPADLVHHWTTQMNTPYMLLSEEEKDSDREQVQRYLPIIKTALETDRPECE
jgi:hypothetical protein